MSRSQNTRADALAALAATLALPIDTTYHLTVATRHLVCPKYVVKTKEFHIISTDFEPRDWRFSLIDYTLYDILSDDPKEAASIRWRSLHFYYDLIVKTLYRRSYDSILLRYLLIQRHKKCLKRRTMAYAELINQVWSWRINCTGLVLLANHDSRCHDICTKV